MRLAPILILLLMTTNLNAFDKDKPHKEGVYHQAYAELYQMLTGDIPLSFKRAVYLTENAFLDNAISYEAFNKAIRQLGYLAGQVVKNTQQAYPHRNQSELLKNAAVFQVLMDTTTFILLSDSTGTYGFQTLPSRYDLEDFWGEKDWTKMFVIKLLLTNTGNCHSLPILYKILAEELGTKAYLAMAPNHTYIRQWSEKTGWYNTELTTGTFPRDADIKWNSYIKTEAVANGVYMDTLSQQQSIAYMLADLAHGYYIKHGTKDLATPLNWLATALKYYPNYINARILRAELMKKQLQQWMAAHEIKTLEALRDHSTGNGLLTQVEQAYFSIYRLGYRKMPHRMYLNWLFSAVKKDSTYTPYRFTIPQPFKSLGYKVHVATAGDGTINEFYDQDTLAPIGTVLLHKLTSKIVALETKKLEDSMPAEVISRMYDPQLGRFWQVDPLADLREWLTPYNFVQNNPIIRVDPTGALDDYFDREGNFLGSDEAKTDIVRIVEKEVWDQMKTVNDDGSETIANADGILVSIKHSEANLSKEQSLNIYDHYNPTDLELANSDKPNPGASFYPKEGEEKIKVRVDANHKVKIGDHANEITNVLVHEAKHYEDYKEFSPTAFNELYKTQEGKNKIEGRAVQIQMLHSSFSKTRKSFQKGVIIYGLKFGLPQKVRRIGPQPLN